MKKGFTLVEILAVVILITIVALIAVPNVLGVLKDSKEKLYESQVSEIEESCQLYVQICKTCTNIYEDDVTEVEVPITDLVSNGYLEKIPVNPKTNEDFSGTSKVIVTKNSNGVFNYNFVE